MANITLGHGGCPPPFLPLSQYPYTSGFEQSRLCAPVPSAQGSTLCCLPCPMTDLFYPDDFSGLVGVANWLNVGGIACCMMLLLSFLALPVQATHRHYLTVCLVISVGMMAVSFIIPLGRKPEVCYDAITANDMYSDLSCAFTGSLLLFGGLAAVIWVFLRSLSLHLQICWQVIPGRKFFFGSLLTGWGVPAISLALVLSLTKISYRFGTTCHINHDRSVPTYWGPILAFAVAAGILQFVTLGYCIRVYIRSLLQPEETTTTETGLPSYQVSVHTVVSARAAYRRVRKVITLQWRGIFIVLIIIVDVIFLSLVFIKMDMMIASESRDLTKVTPWLACLILNGGEKNACLDHTSGIVVNEATVVAVLYLLSLNSYWSFIFLGRLSMIPAWIEFVRRPFKRTNEFVSRDARRLSDPRNYEMLTSPPQTYRPKTPDNLKKGSEIDIRSPGTSSNYSITSQKDEIDSFGKEAVYLNTPTSFSKPKPPSRSASGAAARGAPTVTRDRADSSLGMIGRPSPSAVVGRMGSLWEREGNGSAMGLDRIGSPSGQHRTRSAFSSHQPTGSALSSHRPTDSALSSHRPGSSKGIDWDSSSTYARPSMSPQPTRRNPAQEREWVPRYMHATGGVPQKQTRSDSASDYQWER